MWQILGYSIMMMLQRIEIHFRLNLPLAKWLSYPNMMKKNKDHKHQNFLIAQYYDNFNAAPYLSSSQSAISTCYSLKKILRYLPQKPENKQQIYFQDFWGDKIMTTENKHRLDTPPQQRHYPLDKKMHSSSHNDGLIGRCRDPNTTAGYRTNLPFLFFGKKV